MDFFTPEFVIFCTAHLSRLYDLVNVYTHVQTSLLQIPLQYCDE